MDVTTKRTLSTSELDSPSDLTPQGTNDISAARTLLLADVSALYLKTKHFYLHMSGPHLFDYNLLLDEHGDQLFATTDPIAECARNIGGATLRSICHVARLQRISNNDAEYVHPLDMLAELCEDNKILPVRLREVHVIVNELHDIATASPIETRIDETEPRTRFLFESSRRGDKTWH
jgi:starvation-inducible DNA-binding protein